MKLEDLEELIEKVSDKSPSSIIAKLFLGAMTDWRTEINSLEQLENQISIFIKARPNYDSISNSLNNLDVTAYAWECESISQILELYNYFDKSMTLMEIINIVEMGE